MITLAVLLAAAPAQPQASAAPREIEAIEQCRGITGIEARVRCYDEAAAALAAARASGAIVVVDREQVRETRRSLFGFDLPKMPFFNGDKSQEEDEPKEAEGVVQSVRLLPDDRWLVTLESGARWQTTEAAGRQLPPRPGQAVRMRKASMGSYLLSVQGRRGVRAMRVR